MDKLPIESYARRVILVLPEHRIERLAYSEQGTRLLNNPEVALLPFPEAAAWREHPVVQSLAAADLLRPGLTLVQNPYDQDAYSADDAAVERFALDKHMYFSQLCRHLGATHVSVRNVKVQATDKEARGRISASAVGRSGGLEFSNKLEERLRQETRLDDIFVGGELDIDAAMNLLRTRHLTADPTMSSLVEIRRGGSNPLKKRQLRLNLSLESHRAFKAVGRLSLPGFLDIKPSLDVDTVSRLECIMETEISF